MKKRLVFCLYVLVSMNVFSQNVGINVPVPVEKLDISGHLKITGLIKPNGSAGSVGQVLSNNGDGTMNWGPVLTSWSYDDQNIYNNNIGMVGIGGLPSGSFKLDILGNTAISRDDGNTNSLYANNSILAIQRRYPFPTNTDHYLKIDEESLQSAGSFTFPSTVFTRPLHINPFGGQVTIGTSKNLVSGGYKLAVNGSVKCREVVVENALWPDYVFDKKYPLKSIDELEKFIHENGHLPNIPKASEIYEKGQAVGEIQKLMMEKIEELSLYIIQLKKEIDVLKVNK